MNPITVYFNHNCSKCRHAVEILEQENQQYVQYVLIRYLDQPPAREVLANLVEKLIDPPIDLIRVDSNFNALGLNIDDYQSVEQIVNLLKKHPQLIQRPILVGTNIAAIARSTERVMEFLARL